MPFGLSYSPNCFGRLMNLGLKDNEQGRKRDTIAYLDDVILSTENLEGHLSGYRRILIKFEKAGLKLKPEKLKILVPKLIKRVLASGVFH